jgi:hypothetical protein
VAAVMTDRTGSLGGLLPRVFRDAAAVGILAHAGVATWRVLGVVVLLVGLGTLRQALGGWRSRGNVEARNFVLACAAQVLSVTAMAITGAMNSPMLPIIGAVVILPTAMYGCDR